MFILIFCNGRLKMDGGGAGLGVGRVGGPFWQVI